MKQPLPDWTDCKAAVDAGTATPLAIFIYENEPADIMDTLIFREGLSAALDFVIGEKQDETVG